MVLERDTTTVRSDGGAERSPVALALVLGVPVALVALVVSMVATGAAVPGVLGDAGPVVRWGLPVLRTTADLAVSVVLGSLLLLAVALVPASPAWRAVSRLAAGAAVVWVLAAVVQPVLTYADIAGTPLSSGGLGGQIGFFLTQVPPGRTALATAVLAVLAGTLVALGTATPTSAAVAGLLTAAALVPIALGSHGSTEGGHHTAVSGWWLHALGVGAWVGGLVALAVAGPHLGRSLPVVVRRYSALALGSFGLVVLSGLANGWVQVGATPAGLLSPYGALLGVKTAAAVALGAAGWVHRRSAIATLEVAGAAGGASAGRPFWRLVAVEVLVMAATVGVAVALVRTGPPAGADDGPRTLAAQLTNDVVPPLPATPVRLLTEPAPDLLWLVACGALAVLYAAGLRRLRTRGDRWPVGRSVSWFAGVVVLAWATSFGPQAYIDLLFSAHMVAHMTIMMVAPILLVAGAPITLAVRTLPKRRDGSRGPREWLLLLVHSRWARFVSHPLVAAVLFAGSVIVFYYSPLFGLALSTHLGHELMEVHFLLTGYLFASAVIGVDPGAWNPPYPLRLLLLLATMAFHAFFGVALTGGDELLAADWFSRLGLGVDALADQRTGGAIAWGIGEMPTLVLAIVLAVQWSRSDERETRRRDRAADRDGDAELTAYNAMLAARSGTGQQGAGKQER
ncbi:copper resistance protein CopD [Streptomyces sp. NP160]|uniref:cytochrome c oxidase assembly protein n=1 Tax=Streptomyces sp. NP160 TaxID=2586637 RepID=UPI00111B37FF|nr:cytochrome c oxidase assembly protein [Streptomyces sp. NP160]TNM69085.1 copper resistance protein CopD [Streptomyces sp. NP160]